MFGFMHYTADLTRKEQQRIADERKAREYLGLSTEDITREEQLKAQAERRQAFREYLEGRMAGCWHHDCASWLAACQNAGGRDLYIDAFVEAEGGGMLGWGQVWIVFGQIMQHAQIAHDDVINRR